MFYLVLLSLLLHPLFWVAMLICVGAAIGIHAATRRGHHSPPDDRPSPADGDDEAAPEMPGVAPSRFSAYIEERSRELAAIEAELAPRVPGFPCSHVGSAIPGRETSRHFGQYEATRHEEAPDLISLQTSRVLEIWRESMEIALSSDVKDTAEDRFDLALEAYWALQLYADESVSKEHLRGQMEDFVSRFPGRLCVNVAKRSAAHANTLKTLAGQLKHVRRALEALDLRVVTRPDDVAEIEEMRRQSREYVLALEAMILAEKAPRERSPARRLEKLRSARDGVDRALHELDTPTQALLEQRLSICRAIHEQTGEYPFLDSAEGASPPWLPKEQDRAKFMVSCAILDEECCLDCLLADGKIAERHPMHAGCRCSLDSVRKRTLAPGWKEVDRSRFSRPMRFGPIPEDGGAWKAYLIERHQVMRQQLDSSESARALGSWLEAQRIEPRFAHLGPYIRARIEATFGPIPPSS